MKERPILMTPENAQKCHDGTKTQTRRIIKPQPPEYVGKILGPGMYAPIKVDKFGEEYPGEDVFGVYSDDGEWGAVCHYGQAGDRLWIKHATWKPRALGDIRNDQRWNPVSREIIWRVGAVVSDVAGVDRESWRKVPNIHMPRWACRTVVELTEVKANQLGQISEDDARAEGVNSVAEFIDLWKSIHKIWEPSLLVWVFSFRKVQP